MLYNFYYDLQALLSVLVYNWTEIYAVPDTAPWTNVLHLYRIKNIYKSHIFTRETYIKKIIVYKK